jgi:hypothetical protein
MGAQDFDPVDPPPSQGGGTGGAHRQPRWSASPSPAATFLHDMAYVEALGGGVQVGLVDAPHLEESVNDIARRR